MSYSTMLIPAVEVIITLILAIFIGLIIPGIERRYIHKSLDEVAEMQQKIKQLQTQGESELLQAEIDLQQHISAVGDTAKRLRTTLKVNNSV